MKVRADRWARVISATVLLAALAAFGWLVRPLPTWTPPTLDTAGPASAPAAPSRPGVEHYAVIWQRDLRQPLFDVAPAAPIVATPAPPPFQLLGTAVEADHRFAVFQLSDGTTTVRASGSRIGGFELLEVERGRVRMRKDQQEYELRVPWYARIAQEQSP